jgi:hypothetical protein
MVPANPLKAHGPDTPAGAWLAPRWRPVLALLLLVSAFALHYVLWP